MPLIVDSNDLIVVVNDNFLKQCARKIGHHATSVAKHGREDLQGCKSVTSVEGCVFMFDLALSFLSKAKKTKHTRDVSGQDVIIKLSFICLYEQGRRHSCQNHLHRKAPLAILTPIFNAEVRSRHMSLAVGDV